MLERQRGPDNDTEASSSCPQSDYAQDAHSQYILCFKNQTSVYCRFLLKAIISHWTFQLFQNQNWGKVILWIIHAHHNNNVA